MPEAHVFKTDELPAALGGFSSIAVAFFMCANDWAGAGKLDAAITDYSAALSINPAFAKAYVNRGVAWERKGDLGRAIADYEAALRIDPQDTLARYNLSLALQGMEDVRGALSSARTHAERSAAGPAGASARRGGLQSGRRAATRAKR